MVVDTFLITAVRTDTATHLSTRNCQTTLLVEMSKEADDPSQIH